MRKGFSLSEGHWCLIRLSEMHPRHPVITTDLRDFRVYRRGRRGTIPPIYPPAFDYPGLSLSIVFSRGLTWRVAPNQA